MKLQDDIDFCENTTKIHPSLLCYLELQQFRSTVGLHYGLLQRQYDAAFIVFHVADLGYYLEKSALKICSCSPV